MKYTIITGASKGLGLESVKLLSKQEDCQVLALSRHLSEALKAVIDASEGRVRHQSIDLSEPNNALSAFQTLLNGLDLSCEDAVTLFNNAGTIGPIAPLQAVDAAEFVQNINVNLLSTSLLTAAFLRAFKDHEGPVRLANVSSGAGKRPIAGWSPYCISKAGVDMLTRTAAEDNPQDNFKCFSFGPGVMDTDMQATIRSSAFETLEKFKALKADGKLLPPVVVAQVLVDLIDDCLDYDSGALLNVGDFLTES